MPSPRAPGMTFSRSTSAPTNHVLSRMRPRRAASPAISSITMFLVVVSSSGTM